MLTLLLILVGGGLVTTFLAVKVAKKRDNKIGTSVFGGLFTVVIAACALLAVSNCTTTKTRWVDLKSQRLARAPVLSAIIGMDDNGNLTAPVATALYSTESKGGKNLIPLVGDDEHLINWDTEESLCQGEFAVVVQAEESYRKYPTRSPWNLAAQSYWGKTGRIRYTFLYPVGDGPSAIALKQ